MARPRTIHAELLTVFARVIVICSYIDAAMSELLAYLLHADHARMYVVTQNVSAATLADWIRVLLTVPSVRIEAREELAALLADADEVRGERNALVHGLWSPGPEDLTAMVQTVRWDRSEVTKQELVTLADLNDLLHRAEGILREFRRFGRQLGLPGL